MLPAQIGVCCAKRVSTAFVAVTSVLEADAVSTIEPAFRSSSVTVWVPLQVTDAPGARLIPGTAEHAYASGVGVSATVTLCRVMFPLLVAVTV